MRRALEYAARPRRHAGPALRGRAARRGRPHARGRVVEPARHPGPARRGRGADGDPRHRARPAHRRAGALPAPVDRGLASRWCARPRPTALPVTAEATPHHFTLTDECCAGYDPVFKVNPPLRTDGRRRRGAARAWPTARSTPSPPTTRRTRRRRRSSRSTRRRPGCSASRRRSPSRSPSSTCPIERCSRCCRGSRPRSPGSPTARRADRGRARRPTSASSTRRPSGWSTRPRSPAAAATRRTPAARCRAGCATRCSRGEAGRRRRRGAAMNADMQERRRRSARRCSCSPTARSSRARLIGADAAGRWRRGEVVFNTVLSGYQEVITDPSYAGQIITFTYPHIGNYGVNRRRRREPRGRSAAASSSATSPAGRSNWRARATSTRSCVAHGVAGIAGIDTRRLTRHIRDAGAMPGAFGTAERGRRCSAAAQAEPGTDGIDLVAEVTSDRAVHGRRRARAASSPTTSGSSARSCATSAARHRRGRAGLHDRGRRARPRARRRVPLERPRRPGDGRRTRSTTSARCSARCRCSASASATSCSAPALGARTFKLPFGHHGGNHPVRHLATGQVEITSQNHNFAVDADGRSPAAPTMTHVNLNDGVCRGASRCRDAPAFSVQYHPEAGPGPARRALPVRRVPRADGARRR